MAQSKQPCAIPTSLSAEQFDEFVCPFLTEGPRGPKPKVPLGAVAMPRCLFLKGSERGGLPDAAAAPPALLRLVQHP
jgi:hypothetical protein